MGAVNQLTDSISNAIGTNSSEGGLGKLGKELTSNPLVNAAFVAAGSVFGGPAGAALVNGTISRAQGHDWGQVASNAAGAALGSYAVGQVVPGLSGGGADGFMNTIGASGTGTAMEAGGDSMYSLANGTGTFGQGSALSTGNALTGTQVAGMGGGTGLTATGAALPTLAEMGGGTGLLAGGMSAIGPTAGATGAGAGALSDMALSGAGLTSATGTGTLADAAATGINATGTGTSQLIGQGLNLAGGLLTGESARQAANTNADAQIRAAQIAADAAKFRPVGVTNNFGSSKFTRDAEGNITGAGYDLAPWLQQQQGMLQSGSKDSLTRALQAQSILTDQMAPSAGRMFELGKGYLAADPAEQAQKYMGQQQALLAGSRASSYADMQNRLQQTGRAGLSVGGGGGMMAANPEMNAYYNAQRQQDLQLAANADQGGMNYAKFGVDMTNSGANTLQNMFKTQSAAFDPYKTQMDIMTGNENMGRQNLLDSMNIGSTISQANARAGLLTANGMTNAAAIQAPANAYNPWASLISGAGNMLSNYKWGT